MSGNVRKSKMGSIILNIIFYSVLVAAIVIVFLQRDSNRHGLGGYHLFKVLSSSMESVYPRGSIILVKDTPAKELVVGDDITFLREDNKVITHRIIEIKNNYEGTEQSGFVTKGVENATADADMVFEKNVIGKVVKSFPRIGATIEWIDENLLLVVVFLVALIGGSFCFKIFLEEKGKEKEIL